MAESNQTTGLVRRPGGSTGRSRQRGETQIRNEGPASAGPRPVPSYPRGVYSSAPTSSSRSKASSTPPSRIWSAMRGVAADRLDEPAGLALRVPDRERDERREHRPARREVHDHQLLERALRHEVATSGRAQHVHDTPHQGQDVERPLVLRRGLVVVRHLHDPGREQADQGLADHPGAEHREAEAGVGDDGSQEEEPRVVCEQGQHAAERHADETDPAPLHRPGDLPLERDHGDGQREADHDAPDDAGEPLSGVEAEHREEAEDGALQRTDEDSRRPTGPGGYGRQISEAGRWVRWTLSGGRRTRRCLRCRVRRGPCRVRRG